MHMGMMRGDMGDPAQMGEHIERMVGHLAVEIDATPEQESKLAEIAKAAAAELVPLRQQWREARTDAIALLTAPTVDRAAIEQFRAAQLQLADTASKELAEALADAAEVLTPEQRQALAERMEQFRGRRH
jgi:Spy/CpxP family protein refolding chaperone